MLLTWLRANTTIEIILPCSAENTLLFYFEKMRCYGYYSNPCWHGRIIATCNDCFKPFDEQNYEVTRFEHYPIVYPLTPIILMDYYQEYGQFYHSQQP